MACLFFSANFTLISKSDFDHWSTPLSLQIEFQVNTVSDPINMATNGPEKFGHINRVAVLMG